jgi:hypothetical protein
MTKDTLLFALGAERLASSGDSITVPEERDATFMVAGSGETIQIGKVVRIELRDAAVCLETAKGERFWLGYDLVLGLQLRSAKTANEHGAGFAR